MNEKRRGEVNGNLRKQMRKFKNKREKKILKMRGSLKDIKK